MRRRTLTGRVGCFRPFDASIDASSAPFRRSRVDAQRPAMIYPGAGFLPRATSLRFTLGRGFRVAKHSQWPGLHSTPQDLRGGGREFTARATGPFFAKRIKSGDDDVRQFRIEAPSAEKVGMTPDDYAEHIAQKLRAVEKDVAANNGGTRTQGSRREERRACQTRLAAEALPTTPSASSTLALPPRTAIGASRPSRSFRRSAHGTGQPGSLTARAIMTLCFLREPTSCASTTASTVRRSPIRRSRCRS